MKTVFVVVLACFLYGCADFKEHNQMIKDSNVSMFTAYGNAMARQKSEGGRMAVQSAYLMRVGQQPYQRPETFLDYSTGLLPYANLFMNAYGLWGNVTDDSPTYKVEGAYNSLYVTNESDSRNTSADDSYNTRHKDSYNTLDDSPTDSNTVDWNQANPVAY